MADRNGLPLRAGDAVIIDEALGATVLRVLPENRYLVPLDPSGPRTLGTTPEQIAMQDQLDALKAEIALDTQKPLIVTVEQLLYSGGES